MNEIYSIRQRALEYQQNDDLASLQEQENIRKRNYIEFWKLYKGLHWEVAELDDDKPTAVQNKCFVIVNKGITFLVGKPWTVNYFNDEVEKLLAPYVNLIVKNSGGFGKFGFESAQMGGVSGDCFLKIVYDPVIDGVRIQVCESGDVDVRYPFRDYVNAAPSKAVIQWTFLEELPEPPKGSAEVKREDGLPNVVTRKYKEVWTGYQKAVYIDGTFDAAKSGVNLLGEVPIVHIRNLIVGKDVYGMSDIEQLEPLNKLLNHQLRRFSDDTDYCGDPITLLFGARIGTMEKGEGNLWGNLPIKGRVENLTLDTDFPAQQKFIEYMETAIHETGGVPKQSVTGNENVSNTSGVALHINYLPLIELTDRKKITYGEGFERALMMALKLMVIVEQRREVLSSLSVEDQIAINGRPVVFKPNGILDAVSKIESIYLSSDDPSVRLRAWNEISVQFADYLPKDKLVEMQLIKEEMGLGLESRRGAMKRLGKDNIELKLKEIDDDMEKRMEMELEKMYGQPNMRGTAGGMRAPGETPAGAAKEIK